MTNKGKGKAKGKEIAGKVSAAKRKIFGDDDKTGGGRKKRNRGVLQFIEDAADIDEYKDSDDSDFSDFSDDYVEEEFETLSTMNKEPAKGQSSSFPFIPKEEEVDEEEYERMMEERFRQASKFIRFAGDEFDDKIIDPNYADVNESVPTIWKVKCTVGRERLSAFCLMQKFADLKVLGTKLQIISAFAVDHMKGYVYIEAERQCDINEACNGISGIYVTRVQPVPRNEVFHLFSVRSKNNEISVGAWARIKSGHYKGDIAQVVAVNNTSKKVTVKLIPRIDLQALAAKFGGGYSRQKTAVPAPRLISSSELEEFRPLIQIRRDRDTGKVFEVLDGLLLKDGYVYKKVSPDSLNLWGVEPTEEELLKFVPSENNESKDLEWLSQLYGDSKKKRVLRADKGGGKGESSSGSGVGNGFALYDLVCFGKKDFGLIVGMDKDDSVKILKESPDGPVAVNIEQHDIKSGLFDLKLSAQDHHNKTILVNDSVKILEGPSKGRQGIVKHIYRGIVFLYDGSEEENGGYFTSKSNMCEKLKLTVGDCSGKDSEPGPSVFEDMPSSPRSPLSPKKPWQARENNREFNRGDKDNLFTIGQTLRIRIGPLKGYLCRVIALRRTDVTVKLDSQQKVLTVKCEHLSEVQGKGTAVSTRGNPDSSSSKPFDLLGTEGGSGGWMDGVGTSTGGGGWNAGGTSTGGGGWNAGGTSTERSAWSNHSAPSVLESANPIDSEGVADTAWETKKSNQNSSWGASVENNQIASDPDRSGGWGKGGGSWGQAEHKTDGGQNSNWKNKVDDLDGNQPSGWDSKSNWNTTKPSEKESAGWNQKCDEGNKDAEQNGQSSWNSVKISNENSASGWGQGNGLKSGSDDGGNNWNAPISSCQVNSGWNQKSSEEDKDQGDWSAGKASDGSVTGLGQASGWKKGSSDGVNSDSSWGTRKSSSSNAVWKRGPSDGAREGSSWGNIKSGSSTVAENQDNDWGKASNLNSVSADTGGSQGNGWGQRSNWKSGSTNESIEKEHGKDSSKDSWKGGSATWKPGSSGGNENKNSNWSSGCAVAGSNDSNWGKKTNLNSGHSGNQASDLKNSSWSSGSGDLNRTSNWGKNNNSSGGAGNENNNSNWSSGHADTGNEDSNWGKKSNWNSGNSGNQASDLNLSKWNSGSGESNQNSNWGKNSNWSAGSENKNSNWSSGNQDSSWGKKSNWSSGSGDTNQNTNCRNNSNWNTGNATSGENEGLNETSDDGVGGGNWRGGYRGRGDRGGFRGRGFRGRGERGGFGGRGRSDGEGFGGRWGSERGFGGRGRGRGDQSGGWNDRKESGEDGSSDWKKGGDNVEGWKSSKGSGAWNQESGDKKDGHSWSQGNADNERPSWNQGGGSNKQWQSWSSASGGASGDCKRKGLEQSGSASWNQESGDKKDGQSWSKGNADKECPTWNQGGGSNKQWQSGSSASGGASDNWNSNFSKQTAESNDGSGWTSHGDNGSSLKKSTAIEGTNIQDGGWNKGPNSNTTSRGWDNQEMGWKSAGSGSDVGDRVLSWGPSSAADKGQSSSWNESADGAAGSWGKRNDGSDKGGW